MRTQLVMVVVYLNGINFRVAYQGFSCSEIRKNYFTNFKCAQSSLYWPDRFSPLYSLFNSVITGFGIYEAIKAYKLRQEEQFNYINGFKIGLIAGTVATAVFTVFFAFYSTELNPSFYTDTMAKLSMDSSVGLVIFAVGMLGIATTVIITLTLMQLFKPSNNLA